MVSDVKFELINSEEADDQAEVFPESSDLIKGVYEGGFKTWECSIDLVEYMATGMTADESLVGKKIMELGCGSGLPGIFALSQCGAARVDFQDYNMDVLTKITMPNVLLNVLPQVLEEARNGQFEHELNMSELASVNTSFWSGDWQGLNVWDICMLLLIPVSYALTQGSIR
jgi:hypothetical protein